jgi:hypothetical protein
VANEFKHKAIGTSLTQAEWEATDGTGHIFDSQAAGDILYASSTTALARLAVGSTNGFLVVASGLPAWDTSPTLTDDLTLNLGTDNDIVAVNRSTALAADAELSNVIVGTSNHQGVAANSLLLSNITSDGDMMFLVSDGGNSLEFLLANADSADLQVGHGMATVNIKTASGAITLTPATDTIVANGTGFLVGHTAGLTVSRVDLGATLTPEFQVLGTASDDAAALIGQFSADALGPSLIFQKSRHATIGSNTVVVDDDRLGTISWQGADGGGNVDSNGAEIYAAVDGTPGTNDIPTRLVFATTPDGSATPAEHLRIDAAGLVTITRGDAGAVPTILDASSGTGQTSSTDETTLYTYTLPANTLVNVHDAVFYHASGTFAANGNNKTLTAYFGATTLGTTGAQAYNGVAWDVTVMAYMSFAGNQRIITTISVNGVVQDIEYDSPAGANDETGTIVLAIKGTAANSATGEIVKRLAYTELRPIPA